jgi:hypothetical protein
MQYRIVPSVAAPVLLAVAGFVRPPALEAQTASAARPITVATRLETLSRERAARWTGAVRVIDCAPAPLTERPGSPGELARPHVVPLEEAFLDAATVKRTFAIRLQPLSRPIR